MTREEAVRILGQYDVSAIQFYETDGREIPWDKGHEALEMAIEALAQLPSARPEREKGKWMFLDPPWFRCSECGATRENKTFMENFCPNCGADMRGERNEND